MITPEKAYVLGLLIGGGTITESTFVIVLPFDKWGARKDVGNLLVKDVFTRLRSIFLSAYEVEINYDLGNKGKWKLKPEGEFLLQPILDDLVSLGLPCVGFLLNTADLSSTKKYLKGLLAEKFVTGIFDARGSVTESHRRFVETSPVVSIEVPGKTMNFKFVVQLCSWLTELGSVTDQILYNHPCQHSPADPEYRGWKKGFKIRFLATSFISQNSFFLRSKVEHATVLSKRQKNSNQPSCPERIPRTNTLSIHNDVGSTALPIEVRSKIFLHYLHICAAMGCQFAPQNAVLAMIPNAKNHISVFPLLSKGNFNNIKSFFLSLITTHFPSSSTTRSTDTCGNLRVFLSKNGYSDGDSGLAYLVSTKLNGKRHVGSKNMILEKNKHISLVLESISGVQGSPIFVGNSNNKRGVILSNPLGAANQQALRNKIVCNGIDIYVR